jgi:hypothetical protein
MTENRTPDEQPRSVEAAKGKKAYNKPTFRYEKVFETAALSCGKIAGTSAVCNSSRKTS